MTRRSKTNIISTTAGVGPFLWASSAELPVQWSDRDARILASVCRGLEQAARREGTILTDHNLSPKKKKRGSKRDRA